MNTIERILCPVDLSRDSDKSLLYGAALARTYHAGLTVCYCANDLEPVGTLSRSGDTEEISEVVRRSVNLFVNPRMGSEESSTFPRETIVIEGRNPAEAISREAAARGADLIVMCSRRRPVRAALLGSTAESVYRSAPCPVLVTHPDQREWVSESCSEVTLKRVLIAHDFSDYSELALRYAISLAQEFQAELHLLHALPAPIFGAPELAWVPSHTEGEYHKAARRLQKAVPREGYRWCDVKSAVRWGKPYREILSYATENEIDVICMGAHGSGFGMQTLLGSNVDRVMRQSPCPVLVARPRRPEGFEYYN